MIKREALSLDEVRKVELQILYYIDALCKREGISYFITAGTLIGAVRHKGFIPWDDDIDLVMFRKDYDRLIDIMSKERSFYKMLSPYNNDNYYYPFSKVVDTRTTLIEYNTVHMKDMGVCVDIFPLDKLPQNEKDIKKMQHKCWNLRRVMGWARCWIKGDIKRGIPYKILCLACYIYGWKRAFKKFDEIVTAYNETDCTYYTDLTDSTVEDYRVPAGIFDEVINLPFEDGEFCAVKRYDEYLQIGYGNYMQLPPEEQRVRKHNFDAFWK